MQAKSSTYVTEKKLLRSTVRTGPFTLRTNPRHVRAWCEWSLRQFLRETEDRELWNNGGAVRTRGTSSARQAAPRLTVAKHRSVQPCAQTDAYTARHKHTPTHRDADRQTDRQTDTRPVYISRTGRMPTSSHYVTRSTQFH